MTILRGCSGSKLVPVGIALPAVPTGVTPSNPATISDRSSMLFIRPLLPAWFGRGQVAIDSAKNGATTAVLPGPTPTTTAFPIPGRARAWMLASVLGLPRPSWFQSRASATKGSPHGTGPGDDHPVRTGDNVCASGISNMHAGGDRFKARDSSTEGTGHSVACRTRRGRPSQQFLGWRVSSC